MKTQSSPTTAFNRRELLIGAGGILLGGAVLSSSTAKAAEGGSHEYIYAAGVVWNSALPGLSGQLRLNVYLGVLPTGKGTGIMSDPLHPEFAGHLRILETVQAGNRYEFRGEISDSNTAALIGERLDVVALVHGEATILNLRLAGAVFPGLGRITNLRANASGLAGGLISFP